MIPNPRVCNSILELVGATPLIRLVRIPEPGGAGVFVKLEHFNPTGSHKDRIAAKILERAEKEGTLQPGAKVVEASCGSFAISLALACAIKGYPFIAVLPDSVTREHLDVLDAYSASVELTPAAEGMAGASARAAQIAAASPGSYRPNQYENLENWSAHARGEGLELAAAARESGGTLDAFVNTVGTGGTLSGVAEVIRREFPAAVIVQIVLTGEREGSARLALGRPVPGMHLPDRTIDISEKTAWRMKQRLAREEGLLVGITSGANVAGALHVARELGPGKSVYTLCCDSGERYLSLEGTLA
jgi:cysteine synthase A